MKPGDAFDPAIYCHVCPHCGGPTCHVDKACEGGGRYNYYWCCVCGRVLTMQQAGLFAPNTRLPHSAANKSAKDTILIGASVTF